MKPGARRKNKTKGPAGENAGRLAPCPNAQRSLRCNSPWATLLAEAVTNYWKALEIRPDYAEAHNKLSKALAAAYAEAGQFPEPVATARQALELAMRKSRLGLAREVRDHIALYQARKPFHQAPAPPQTAPPAPSDATARPTSR